jgi:DNA-binding response OmpR family regulator
MREKPVVMVVDDDEDVTRCVARFLEGAGFVVRPVHEGWAAMETAVEVKPDVILLDIKLPFVQGDAICQYLKRVRGDMGGTKVVMMSGSLSDSDRRWVERCGADDILAKPFERDELLEMMASLIAGERAMPSPPVVQSRSPVEIPHEQVRDKRS